jgi:hypothetical protein
MSSFFLPKINLSKLLLLGNKFPNFDPFYICCNVMVFKLFRVRIQGKRKREKLAKWRIAHWDSFWEKRRNIPCMISTHHSNPCNSTFYHLTSLPYCGLSRWRKWYIFCCVSQGWIWWWMSVNLVAWEAYIGGLWSKASLGKKHKILSKK